jgi:transposase
MMKALRDLVRTREDAVGLSTQTTHRLKAFLLRQGRRYPGRAGWTTLYRRWLADLSFPLAPQHIALQEYRDTIDEAAPPGSDPGRRTSARTDP